MFNTAPPTGSLRSSMVNLDYHLKLWTRNPGWSDYTQLNNPGLNQIENPIITWILLRKK
jgi:hypothetical protein